MARSITTVIFFVLLFVISNVSSEEKFVFVDINYIYNNSSAGKSLNKQIQDQTKKINSDLNKFQKKINSEKETLITQKNVLSKEEFEKKFRTLEKNLNEYNSIIKKKNTDLINFKKKIRLEFSKELKLLLEDYSKSNSISMILNKENILIGKSNLDATNDLLNLFNKKVKKISVK